MSYTKIIKQAGRRWVLLATVAILFPLLNACLDNETDVTMSDNIPASYFGIGTLRIIQGNDYYFDMDEGSKLYPGDTTALNNYALIEGQRAFIYFNQLPTEKEGYKYNAQIRKIENILTKEIYLMPSDKTDSIGNDPINIVEPIWVAGGYLTINYQTRNSGLSNQKHQISLVVTETEAVHPALADCVTLELRHNAYDDHTSTILPGIASFHTGNITSLLAGKKGVNIRFKSLYEGEQSIHVDCSEMK